MGILNQIVLTKVTKIPRTTKATESKKSESGSEAKKTDSGTESKKVRAARNRAQKKANLLNPANLVAPILLPPLPVRVARKALPEPT